MNKTCLLTCSNSDTGIVKDYFYPVLEKMNIHVILSNEIIFQDDYKKENFIKTLREVDFLIVFINKYQDFNSFLFGAAMGQYKPIIKIVSLKWRPTSTGELYDIINFSTSRKDEFQNQFEWALLRLSSNVIEIQDFRLYRDRKIIGLQFGSEKHNFENDLRLTADLINLIKVLTRNTNIELLQIAKGSLKSIISIDLKSWVELIEKIIFIIPEIKKKKLDRMKVEADIEKIKADTKKVIAESKIIESTIKIQESNAFLDIIERSEKIGLKLQIDNDLILIAKEGEILIQKPN